MVLDMNLGAKQWERYLEDKVGPEALRKVNDFSHALVEEASGQSNLYIEGLNINDGVKYAFYVPINSDKDPEGLCRFFLGDFSLTGDSLSLDSFDAQNPRSPRLLQRIFRRKEIKKVRDFHAIGELTAEEIKREINNIPISYMCPDPDVVRAYFKRPVFFVGKIREGFGRGERIPSVLPLSAEIVRSKAYSLRAEQIVAHVSPITGRLSGGYDFIRLGKDLAFNGDT